jgi:uncharacterized protein
LAANTAAQGFAMKKRIILSEPLIRSKFSGLAVDPRNCRNAAVMKFHLTKAAGRNLFTGYGEGYVSINDQRYDHSVIVAPEGEVEPWDADDLEGLTPAHFEALRTRAPEVLILGTGDTHRFPRPEVIRPLVSAGVGFEAMDTKAACRTYNILMAEGRQVLAAILV